jgi:hypothetical protein
VSEEQRDPIVIAQSKPAVNLLWGFLTIAFALALWRGHGGARTDAGRLVGDILLGAAVVVCLAVWISSLRHPARIEVSHDVIALRHRGKPNAIELRRTGDLYVYRRIMPRGGTQSYLKVEGSDAAIPLVYFNWKDVESACRAAGWLIGPRRS